MVLISILTSVVAYLVIAAGLIVSGKPDKPARDEGGLEFKELFICVAAEDKHAGQVRESEKEELCIKPIEFSGEANGNCLWIALDDIVRRKRKGVGALSLLRNNVLSGKGRSSPVKLRLGCGRPSWPHTEPCPPLSRPSQAL